MLFEYAVEPSAIGSSWKAFRYWIEKFGFDRGRLISRFPKRWESDVIAAAKAADMPDIKLASLVRRLQKAKAEALIASGRDYDPSLGDWLANALRVHALKPFHAMVATKCQSLCAELLDADDVDEMHGLMAAARNWEVPRVGADLAKAMAPLLRTAQRVLFVDRFFDIGERRYRETLKASLDVIAASGSSCIDCEIHYGEHDSRPPANILERDAARWLTGVIPAGISITLFGWTEKANGADLHARYLLTDRGGMNVEAGFSAEGGHQTVSVTLLDIEPWAKTLAAFDQASMVYELSKPILRIFHDGRVQRM